MSTIPAKMIPKRIVIHCSASKNAVYYSADQIDSDHRARGFDKIGYHAVIQPDGQVDRGRSLNEKGAHCIEANHDSVGICLVGLDKFTRRQFKALRYYIDSLMQTYPIEKHAIYVHNQFQSARDQKKSCPNLPVNVVLAWYLLQDEKLMTPYTIEENI